MMNDGFLFTFTHSQEGTQEQPTRETNYCKLVKVQMLCILCNNLCLFVPRELMPKPSLASFMHSVGQVSSPK